MKQQSQQNVWVDRLFSLLLQSDRLHIPSPLSTHYRNKMTYSIPMIPTNAAPLAQENVQDVCRWVDAFEKNSEESSMGIAEVMVKATRSGDLMVRLTLAAGSTKTDAPSDDGAENDEQHCPSNLLQLRDRLLMAFPKVVCLSFNRQPTPGKRPTKTEPLMFLTPKHHVWDVTPDHAYRYRLSPDTFAEVNPTVEAQQYAQTQEWLALERRQTAHPSTLLVSGRDISVFALGYGASFDHVVAIQHCPLVHADAMYNLSDRDKYTVLHCPNKSDMGRMLLQQENQQQTIAGAVLTGGRKGLDPKYIECLVSTRSLSFIIYNSCSTKSLVRDMRAFLGTFRIQGFQSYDFFPGTAYSASLTYLVRCRHSTALVLPIGPAGVGKSTLARQLERICAGGVRVWGRDEVFARLRKSLPSLASTKRQVHKELLEFLTARNDIRSSIRVLDSTNGSRDARALYVQTAQPETVVCVNWNTSNVDWLLTRTAHRLGDNVEQHPSFPTTVEEQRLKHQAIMKGIEFADIKEVEQLVDDQRMVVFTVAPETVNMEDLAFAVLAAIHTTTKQQIMDTIVSPIPGIQQVDYHPTSKDEVPGK